MKYCLGPWADFLSNIKVIYFRCYNIPKHNPALLSPRINITTSAEIDLEEYLPPDSIHDRSSAKSLNLRDLLDISPTLTEAAGAIVDDSFTRCFKSNSPEPWNWNIYHFPLWCLGVLIRYSCFFH